MWTLDVSPAVFVLALLRLWSLRLWRWNLSGRAKVVSKRCKCAVNVQDMLQGVVANGDYVGVSKEDGKVFFLLLVCSPKAKRQDSPQINFTHPWYWFSVDGDCPNLLDAENGHRTNSPAKIHGALAEAVAVREAFPGLRGRGGSLRDLARQNPSVSVASLGFKMAIEAPPTKPQPCDPDGCAGKQDKAWMFDRFQRGGFLFGAGRPQLFCQPTLHRSI